MRLLLLAGAFAGSLTAAAPAVAVEFAPHQADYVLSLHSARQGSGILAVSGEMAADWSGSCEGWTFDHQFTLDVSYATGASARITSNVSTWESRDGREYRFNVRNLADDELTEAFEGSARVGPDGDGKATFEQPEGQTFELPKGTLFPVAHTLVLIAQAAEAPTTVTRPVFDGLSDEGAYEISAVIGKAKAAPAAKDPVVGALSGHRSWPVTMAFFPVGSSDAQPEHEIAMRLYDNGVADEFLIRFDEFAVRAKLRGLKLETPARCNGT